MAAAHSGGATLGEDRSRWRGAAARCAAGAAALPIRSPRFPPIGSTMTVARLDQGQRYRPRMAFLKKVRAEELRVTGSAALGVSSGGTDRTLPDGAPGSNPRVHMSRPSILLGAAPRSPPAACCPPGRASSPGLCRVATWSARHRGFGWWLRSSVCRSHGDKKAVI